MTTKSGTFPSVIFCWPWTRIIGDTLVLVGPSKRSNFPTLSAAFDAYTGRTIRRGCKVTIRIESGHRPKSGLQLEGGDWSQFIIDSEDDVVLVDSEFDLKPTTPTATPSVSNYFFHFANCLAPTISTMFDGNNDPHCHVFRGERTTRNVNDIVVPIYSGPSNFPFNSQGTPNAPRISYADCSTCAGIYYDNSRGTISPKAGFMNTWGRGLHVNNCSNVVADGSIFRHTALGAAAGNTVSPGEGHRGSLICGVDVSFASSLSFNDGESSFAGRNGVQVSTGSTCSARNALVEYNDRYGFRATQGGFATCRGIRSHGNGSHGLYSSFGSYLDASDPTTDVLNNNSWRAWGSPLNGPNRTCLSSAVGSMLVMRGGKVSSIHQERNTTILEGSTIAARGAHRHDGSNITLRHQGSNGRRPLQPNTITADGIIYQ